MDGDRTKQLEREHTEWQLHRLAAEVRDGEAAGSRAEPDLKRLHARLREVGADFGMFRR